MGVPADKLLRLMVAHRQPAAGYTLATLKEVAREEAAPLQLAARVSRRGWREAA